MAGWKCPSCGQTTIYVTCQNRKCPTNTKKEKQ